MNSHSDDEIDMTASIILNDIRLTVYDCKQYEPLETTENGDKFIPSSLKRFLHNLLDCKGRTVSDRRCTAIAHAIISASRPRSFISPNCLDYQRIQTASMPDILSSMSFADDYDYEEVHIQRFEQALMSGGDLSYDLSGFTQFVFDNADFNVAILTGHNTFYSMGGIACVTPTGSMNNSPIKREVKLQYLQIRIKTYSKAAGPGLQSVIIQPLKHSNQEPACLPSAFALDSL